MKDDEYFTDWPDSAFSALAEELEGEYRIDPQEHPGISIDAYIFGDRARDLLDRFLASWKKRSKKNPEEYPSSMPELSWWDHFIEEFLDTDTEGLGE